MFEDNHMEIDPYNEEIWNEEEILNERNIGFQYSENDTENNGLTGYDFIDNSIRITNYLEESSLDTNENDVSYYKFEYKYQKNKNLFNRINKKPKIINNNIRKICKFH
jgi:hypothetical protein